MLQRLIDDQYRHPRGWLGRYIGRSMARDHWPENQWTVAALDVQPSDRVLELGFGPGVAIQTLSHRVAQGQISGLDASRTMVRQARRRNWAAVRSGRVTLACGDAARLPFAACSFDKVFGIHTIYFWPDPLAALHETWRVLRPGGLLALTVLPKARWNANDPSLPVGTPQCRPYDGDELIELMRAVGFDAMRIVQDHDPARPSSFCVIGVRPQR